MWPAISGVLGESVAHRRRVQKGSFGGHFDDLIAQFPAEVPERRNLEPSVRSRELQQKIDIHARLFERAWQLERER